MLGYHSETSEHSLYSIASSQLSVTVVYADVTVDRTTLPKLTTCMKNCSLPFFTRPELWFRGRRLIYFIYSALRLPNGVQICSTPSLPVTNLCSRYGGSVGRPKKTSAGPKRTPLLNVNVVAMSDQYMIYNLYSLWYICRCTWLLNQRFSVTANKYKSISPDGFSTRFRPPSYTFKFDHSFWTIFINDLLTSDQSHAMTKTYKSCKQNTPLPLQFFQAKKLGDHNAQERHHAHALTTLAERLDKVDSMESGLE